MSGSSLSRSEKASLLTTGILGLAAAAWAIWSAGRTPPSALGIAVSVGALGGLAHEIAQSGGKILFFRRYDDGLYLGAIAGMILGAVAGLLVVRGHLISDVTNVGPVQLSYEVFFAGLGLKGVVEAAGGNPSSGGVAMSIPNPSELAKALPPRPSTKLR